MNIYVFYKYAGLHVFDVGDKIFHEVDFLLLGVVRTII